MAEIVNAVIRDVAKTHQALEVLANTAGRVWFEAHGKGLFAAGFSLPESHREKLDRDRCSRARPGGDPDHQIVEGELPIERIRFEGLTPPVVRRPCFAMRKPAHVLYTLDDYVRDGIITQDQAEFFRKREAECLRFAAVSYQK